MDGNSRRSSLMSRLRRLAIGCSFLTLGACASASIVNPPGRAGTANAPSNEESRPGTVKYSNQGADYFIRSRREDAYKKMSEACGGKYSIVSEGPKSEGAYGTVVGNSVLMSNDEYWYINFKCE